MITLKTHEQQFAMQVIRQQQHDEFIAFGPFFRPEEKQIKIKHSLDRKYKTTKQ